LDGPTLHGPNEIVGQIRRFVHLSNFSNHDYCRILPFLSVILGEQGHQLYHAACPSFPPPVPTTLRTIIRVQPYLITTPRPASWHSRAIYHKLSSFCSIPLLNRPSSQPGLRKLDEEDESRSALDDNSDVRYS